MYLSRIALDTKRRETMRAFDWPQLLHGAVEISFAGNRKRNLWRLDWLDNVCYLLVLSHDKPDFTHLVEQFGYPDLEQRWETKDYEQLLARLQAGQVWRFRLCANPTRSSSKEKDEASGRGRVFAHVTPQQQRDWLLRRAQSDGFLLDSNWFDVVDSQWKTFRKGKEGNREVTLRVVTFEGLLTISNLESFQRALQSGIGRAKAYGCGLLTIARLGGDQDA